MSTEIIRATERGLYCPPGDFYVDPWRGVDRAIITHAHSDHARRGSRWYLTSREGEGVLRARMDEQDDIHSLPYEEPLIHNGVRISFHPAGHVHGSSQVRLEYRGKVWVISGDYKIHADPTCTPFQPVKCHGFVTESTFGLPIYRWADPKTVFDDINRWWRANQNQGKCSVLHGYSLGKAQRLLAGVDRGIGPIFCHHAVENLNRVYREGGIDLPRTTALHLAPKSTDWSRALIVIPGSIDGLGDFGPQSTGYASGWMRVRGSRKQRAMDRGFILSDHADWPGLMWAIRETGAEKIWVTHGSVATVVRALREEGRDAHGVRTQFRDEIANNPAG